MHNDHEGGNDDRKRISVRTGLDSSPSRSTRDGIVFVGIDAVGWLAGWLVGEGVSEW